LINIVQKSNTFNDDLTDTDEEMKGLLTHLTETESLPKLKSLELTVISIMQTTSEATDYIQDTLVQRKLRSLPQ
jgi:hypothetical protein